jgi:hypothetical protein
MADDKSLKPEDFLEASDEKTAEDAAHRFSRWRSVRQWPEARDSALKR